MGKINFKVLLCAVLILAAIRDNRQSSGSETSTPITASTSSNSSSTNSSIAANGAATRVLIARTVSPSEAVGVAADVKRINSYQSDPEWYLTQSLSKCNNATSNKPSPFNDGSRTYPNPILCRTAEYHNASGTSMPNYHALVTVDFLFFARNGDVAKTILSSLSEGDDITNLLNVEIMDVSHVSVKIWNWLTYLDEERLSGHDYLMMVDGDISLSSLNWQAYWQQVHLFQPKISQAAVIGTAPGSFSSTHWPLRHQEDPRVIAAETAIVELMTPMFEVTTWLGYRSAIRNESEPDLLHWIRGGGEDCFDLAWCHYSRANFEGVQVWPPKNWAGYDANAPKFELSSDGAGSVGGFDGRSCVVFYQTPVVHGDKRSLEKSKGFREGGRNTCLYFKRKYHIHYAVKSVYETFMASLSR